MARPDAIVIGAGHNGLVTAAYLAKAGRTVLVLERREKVGGILDTLEIAEGVRAPGIVHTIGRLRRSVTEDLGLVQHGLVTVDPAVRLFAPQPDGPPLTLNESSGRPPPSTTSRPGTPVARRLMIGFVLMAAFPLWESDRGGRPTRTGAGDR